MAIRRASHCVYDTRYHLVWAPKYRKWVLQGAVRERVRELFGEIAEHHGFEIEELEVDKDHVHVFLSFPPKYSIGQVVGLLRAVSAREIRAGFPEVRQQLWGGEFWEDGYFVRTVGDKVTADVIKKYIRFHEAKKRGGDQLGLF
ncbi:MAG TPA: IS200/IS605 family transposase [Nitrospira sp.]|nr:IS200/IS605 family transposase [Nitrospira sp. NTP1]HQR14810.1 IS200/IS605 family transposase [Nitrospira sp.]